MPRYEFERSNHKRVAPRYRKVVARIEKLAMTWEPLLALPGIKVEHKFLATRADDDPCTAAVTEAKWNYRWATILWYLPVVKAVSKAELEGLLVHEYAHVLLAVLPSVDGDGNAELEEAATENVAQALLRVRRWSKR